MVRGTGTDFGMRHVQGWAITPNGVRRKLRYVTVIYGFHRNLGILRRNLR